MENNNRNKCETWIAALAMISILATTILTYTFFNMEKVHNAIKLITGA